MTKANSLFQELLQISVGTRQGLSKMPEAEEWLKVYNEAEKHAIVSVLLDGLEKLPLNQRPSQEVILQWICMAQMMEHTYNIHCERAIELAERFHTVGYRSCVLKGISNAQYYPNPQRRQCGDIDIWLDGDRGEVIDSLKEYGAIGHVDVKHCDWKVFEDTPVEVHFTPTWFYNPFVKKRLQKWIKEQKDIQFEHKSELGINTPTTGFNLVYVLIHIYRHVFDEGVGLRQLMDYYYVLQNSSLSQRKEAFEVLKSLKMKSFAGGIMWILTSYLGMKAEYQLCPANGKHGKLLLKEILLAGKRSISTSFGMG